MGIFITIIILLFITGSIMSLKPSAKQKALGNLREKARIAGLQPKLVACPDWLINAHGEKGKGMVAKYGLLLPDATLSLSESLIIDGVIKVVNGDIQLADISCPVEDALGLSMQANFIAIYIKEVMPNSDFSPQSIEKKVTKLKEYLQMTAKKVQD